MSEVHQAAAAAHQGRQQQLLRQKMMEAKERLAALEAAVAAKQQASLTTDNLVKPTLKEPSTVKFVDTPSVRHRSSNHGRCRCTNRGRLAARSPLSTSSCCRGRPQCRWR